MSAMKKGMKLNLIVVMGAVVFPLFSGSCFGAIIFSEDWSSHSADGQVAGTNGWTGGYININSSSQFGGANVLDGNDSTGGADAMTTTQRALDNPLSGSGQIYTLSFDIYAQTTGNPSGNTFMGFGSSSSEDNFLHSGVGWGAVYEGSASNSTEYSFDARSITGDPNNYVWVEGPFDQIVNLRIIIDGIAEEVYGQYDFGNGLVDTQRYSLTAAQIGSIDEVVSFTDHRSAISGDPWSSTPFGSRYSGAQWTNIQVSAIPEPSGILYLGLFFGAWIFKRRRS